MCSYDIGVYSETLIPDDDGFIWASRADLEQPVSVGQDVVVEDDLFMGFARVVRITGDEEDRAAARIPHDCDGGCQV